MTVPYSNSLPRTFSTCGWCRAVLCRWRGGIYKLIVVELAVFIACWYAVFIACSSSHLLVTPAERRSLALNGTAPALDAWIQEFRDYQGNVRVMLGFMLVYYYQQIHARARRIFFAIPFPDSVFIAVNSVVGGDDRGDEHYARGLLLRSTIFRYILSTTFIAYHSSSSKFRHHYPKPYASLVELGLLTRDEVARIRARVDSAYPYLGECAFIPMTWATMTLREAFAQGQCYPRVERPSPDTAVQPLGYAAVVRDALQALHSYRRSYGTLLFEVYLPFPLLLSQLVTLTVYAYFAVAIFAQQDLSSEPQFYFPIFTSLEFVVYMGALRVGQVFTSPLGGEDSDYEMVAFFNRNLRLAHIYGAFGPDKFDLLGGRPPLVDLRDVQTRALRTVPLEFYRPEHRGERSLGGATDGHGVLSRRGSFHSEHADDGGGGDDGNGVWGPGGVVSGGARQLPAVFHGHSLFGAGGKTTELGETPLLGSS